MRYRVAYSETIPSVLFVIVDSHTGKVVESSVNFIKMMKRAEVLNDERRTSNDNPTP